MRCCSIYRLRSTTPKSLNGNEWRIEHRSPSPRGVHAIVGLCGTWDVSAVAHCALFTCSGVMWALILTCAYNSLRDEFQVSCRGIYKWVMCVSRLKCIPWLSFYRVRTCIVPTTRVRRSVDHQLRAYIFSPLRKPLQGARYLPPASYSI